MNIEETQVIDVDGSVDQEQDKLSEEKPKRKKKSTSAPASEDPESYMSGSDASFGAYVPESLVHVEQDDDLNTDVALEQVEQLDKELPPSKEEVKVVNVKDIPQGQTYRKAVHVRNQMPNKTRKYIRIRPKW